VLSLVPSDLVQATQWQLIRPEEFRKNAVEFGWDSWKKKQQHNAF
jgi:hypothetical protein